MAIPAHSLLSWNALCCGPGEEGIHTENFWCDSQLWPVGFGFASKEQSVVILSRIDAQPEFFEGVPTRWCPPLSDEAARELARLYPDVPAELHLRLEHIDGAMELTPGRLTTPSLNSAAFPWTTSERYWGLAGKTIKVRVNNAARPEITAQFSTQTNPPTPFRRYRAHP
jgi:hypothetical protein